MGKTTEITDAALVGIQRDQVHWFFWGDSRRYPIFNIRLHHITSISPSHISSIFQEFLFSDEHQAIHGAFANPRAHVGPTQFPVVHTPSLTIRHAPGESAACLRYRKKTCRFKGRNGDSR